MVVLIINITDAPEKRPTQVDIYNTTLEPGAQIRIPAELVNAQLRTLETNGLIAIGSVPSWYEATKKRKGKELTKEEMMKRVVKSSIKEVPKEIKDDKRKG